METRVFTDPCLSLSLIAKMFIIIITFFPEREREGGVGKEMVFKI